MTHYEAGIKFSRLTEANNAAFISVCLNEGEIENLISTSVREQLKNC